MKKLGAYISPHADTASSSPYFTKGCFVYYEYVSDAYRDILPQVKIWRLDANFNQQPDEVILLKSPSELKEHIATCDTWTNRHISYRDRTYHIRNMKCRFTTFPDIEVIDELSVDAVDHYESWRLSGHGALQFLKDAKLALVYKRQELTLDDFAMPNTACAMIKEAIKKGIEQETKTMEKNITLTDKFMKCIDGISITSTHASIQNGPCKCDIYYPEIKITPKIAEELMVILLDMEKNWTNKVIFNPEKGTTSIAWRKCTITVKCKDAEFSFLIGYMMARCKTLHGCDDYNWFNKIMNHRKTHIEYATPERPKRGGKKS